MSTPAERDTPDLEALFDSIVESRESSPPAPPAKASPTPAPAPAPARTSDVASVAAVVPVLSVAKSALTQDDDLQPSPAHDALIDRIGHLTRSLHDSLRELGYDKAIEKAAAAIPDTRDRLAYVANLTGQAADKVLTLTETALPMQESLNAQSTILSGRWQALCDHRLSVSEFEALVAQTRTYLDGIPAQTVETSRCLRDIMVAQDFHDLTGQVIRKITEMAHRMESELVQLLLENVSPEARADAVANNGLMNGPVINADGRADIVTSQAQVDDLLATLGF